MKTNAIVRIVLFSLAILILLGILLSGLFIRFYSVNFHAFSGKVWNDAFENSGWDTMSNETSGQAGSVAASEIRRLQIDWVSGSITIQPGDTDTICFSESQVSQETYQMVWKQSGDKLVIQFCRDGLNWSGVHFGGDLRKNLTVTVPRDWNCTELNIDAASAAVKVSGLTMDTVEVNTASGTSTFENCKVDEISFDTASGDIYFSGTLNTLDVDAASASCTAILTNAPSRISVDGVSGDVSLTLPESCGFTASLDSVSGNFSSDLPTTVSNGSYLHGDGRCRITINAVSGNLRIQKCGDSVTGSHHSSD